MGFRSKFILPDRGVVDPPTVLPVDWEDPGVPVDSGVPTGVEADPGPEAAAPPLPAEAARVVLSVGMVLVEPDHFS